MTKYSLTDSICDALDNSSVPKNISNKFKSRGWISHHDLIKLYELIDEPKIMVLLRNINFYHPAPQVKPKSPEFLTQMELLRRRNKELEYQRLIKNDASLSLASVGDPVMSPSQEAKQLKHQITTIFNVLVSVCSVSYAVWYWTDSSMRISAPARVLLSLFFGLLVLIAEVVVFNGFLSRVEDARRKETTKKEVRKLVSTVTI